MNIDELEKLARAAQQDSESQARIEFLKIAANPAAILELISINRELEIKLRDEISDHNDTRWNLTQARAALNKE